MSLSGFASSTALLLICTSAAAVEDGASPSSGVAPRSFLVTDFTVSLPLELSDGIDSHLEMAADPGWLFRVSDGFYAGPGLLYGAWLNGGWHTRWGLALRSRIDLGGEKQLDVSPGLILGDSPFPGGFAGMSIASSLLITEWIGVCARFEVTRLPGSEHMNTLYLGVRLGSGPGLVATGLAAAGGAAAYIESNVD